jgi:hypothetical protein
MQSLSCSFQSFLEQFFYSSYPCFLGENVLCREVQSLFGTPLHALGFSITEVANECHSLFWMKLNGAIITRFNAPSTSRTFLLVNHDSPLLHRLLQRISRACGYTWSVFTESASNRQIHEGVQADNTNSRLGWVENLFVFHRTYILTYATTNTLRGISRYKLPFMLRTHFFILSRVSLNP